jgi:predicted homoserine dehydrogenase-like protein
VLTYEDVEIDSSSTISHLRALQDQLLVGYPIRRTSLAAASVAS